ncbi:MAG: hypothetical protein KatS3mg035_0044 [Bacteroidia bacterium]|nr:MAG: hypothetical protein KatS3mg035_0044 [Bacteroidia bacterium]
MIQGYNDLLLDPNVELEFNFGNKDEGSIDMYQYSNGGTVYKLTMYILTHRGLQSKCF